MSGADDGQKPGFRKDGKPYKEDNTREDGSYKDGKYRPPEHGKFRKGDNRPRGKREKGSKNLTTIWRKQLSRRMTINGETKTAAEWLVDATIRRGITRSDRAAENALGEAARLDFAKERSVVGREDEVIAAYMAQRFADLGIEISKDVPEPDDEVSTKNGESNHADQ